MPLLQYAQMQSMPDIKSYATGNDYVEANGELAYLHEGEAVLTKSAAEQLRKNTDMSIATTAGVNDALDNQNLSGAAINAITSAITSQTSAIIFKLDRIINLLSMNRNGSTYNNDMVNLLKVSTVN